MKPLYIRADGNAEIGTGHIMRCLAIADAARAAGQECIFIIADTSMEKVLTAKKFPVICLHSVWNDLDREIEQMEELVVRKSIRSLLVDSYFVTMDYLRRLHYLTRVTYIDDLNQFTYPCSVLVNYNLYVDLEDYSRRYSEAKLLLGPKYAPLRSEFQGIKERHVRPQIQDVLVTTGGTDSLHIAENFILRITQRQGFEKVNFHVVVGRFHQNIDTLERIAQSRSNVILHQNVQCMSKLICTCDLAVSAGGSTLYELCACGIPTICFVLADNQLENVAAFGRAGMYTVGDIRKDFDSTMEKILAAIDLLFADQEKREDMSRRLQKLVDGQGARRIADTIGSQKTRRTDKKTVWRKFL